MHNTTPQQHAHRCRVANWRLCWRELMYVALFLASAQAVIHGQVLRQFCSAATAPAPPRPSLGAEQLVSGLNLPTDLPWARQLLCLSMLDSSSVQVKGSLALRLLRPLAGILLQAVDHVLGFLVRPWLLAALARDPHYLCHLASALLVTACIIWPALRAWPVFTTRRVATHTSLRLLYSTTTLISAHLPGGLFRHYFLCTLAQGGRWKLSAGLAWCHGLLLQAPLALHLPLCVLDWGVASYVSNLIDGDLGAPQQGWIQHCLDGLLIVGVPVAAALLMQHTACTGGSSVPDTSWTPSSSSKAGAPSSSHTHSRHQQQLTHNTTVSPAGPSTAQGRAQTVLAAASPATACVQLRSRKQRSRGAGVHGEGAGPQQGASPYAAAARGAPAPAAARHAPDPAAMRLSAAPYSPTLITAGPAGPGAPHHQQLLPALVASCVYEGWRGLPPECLYTPVTRLVPVNLKVQQPEGMGYNAAAGRVAGSAREAMLSVLPQQQVLAQLVTVPGCVLLMMEVVQPAAGPAAAVQAHTPWAGRPALLQGAWQVALAAPRVSGVPRVAVVADGSGDVPLPQLQQHITTMWRDQGQHSPPPSPDAMSGNAAASSGTPPPAATQSSTRDDATVSCRPCTTCIIGTWGEPLQLQLVAAEGPCAGGVALPPAVRVVLTHLQQVVLDEELMLGAPGAGGGTGSSSSSLGGDGGNVVPTSLVLTCEHLAACAHAASPAAHSQPCVLTVNILPVTPAQGQASRAPTRAALPMAHITVLLLPPEPAAELAGWVAAAQLPAPYVTSWGHDLAVLVGCVAQLRVAQTSPLPLAATPTACGGISRSSKQDLLQLCHLAVAAAGALEGLFSGCGLVCGGDLVAVTKQRVLVGATSLAPMAAGRVVPAVVGGAGGEQVSAVEATAVAAASGLRVTVVAKPPSSAAAASPDALGIGRAGGLEEGVGVLGESTAGTSNGSSSSGSASCDASAFLGSGALEGPGGGQGLDAAPLNQPTRSPSDSSSSSITSKPESCISAATGVPPLVSTAEAAAVSGAGWGALLLCWRGFRAPGAEGAFQSYRGPALRRWDWVCRLYVLVLGSSIMAKKLQVLGLPWASWSAAPAWLIQAELTMHILLLGLAPRWWAAHRDGVLATYHGRVGALWLWEALAWPAHTFRAVYGSSARACMVPVSFIIIHKGPWASVTGCALVCPFAAAALLVQACAFGESGGLDGALYRSIQGRSWLLVVAGMVFSAANLLVALVCSLVVELRVRRAWVREQAAQWAVGAMQVGQEAGTAPAGAGSSLPTRRMMP